MESPESIPAVDKLEPSQTSLEETMKALLAPMQKQLEDLAKENRQLKEEINTLAAEPIHGHIQGNDFAPNPNAARSVVIATRPVRDNPEMYNSKGIVDTGGLYVNNASP